MRFLLAFIFLFSQTTCGPAWAQTIGKNIEFNSVTGADYFTNYVISPNARKNASNTTVSNATVTRDTTAGNLIDNVASYSVDTSLNAGYVEFTLGTVYDPSTSGSCEFKGVFKGDGTLYSAQIVDGSGNLLNSATLTNETAWRPFSIIYPCAASGSRKVRITQTTAGTSPAINVGKLYYGQVTGVGAGVPNNVFSAKVNSAGIVADENEDWINGNASVTDTSLFAITFNTSKFSVGPTCTVTPAQTTATVSPTIKFESASTTTGISVRTYDSSTAAKAAYSFHINCTRAGTDFIQPTITASQWDYGPTSYTPGTGNMPTLSSSDCTHSRKGSKITVVCRFVSSGTGAAGQLSVGLPTGIALSTSTSPVGAVKFLDTGVAHRTGNVTVSGSNFVFYLDSATAAMQGTDITSGDELQFSITFPVVGWTENQNAPQLVGSVTSNASGALRYEGALIANNGSACSVATTSSSWIGTPTRNAAGRCTLPYSGSPFSSQPWCSCIAHSATGAVSSCGADASVTLGTTNFAFVSSQAGTATDMSVTVTCVGPR